MLSAALSSQKIVLCARELYHFSYGWLCPNRPDQLGYALILVFSFLRKMS